MVVVGALAVMASASSRATRESSRVTMFSGASKKLLSENER
jgi:hypothetical protein